MTDQANPGAPGPWVAQSPSQFTDRRSMLKKDTNGNYLLRVNQNVRAYHGVMIRKGTDGKPEYDRCPHAHNKPSAARKCAEVAAKRLNRVKT